MKKLLLILLCLPMLLLAQVPQGVGYQGVATDASGIELVNQPISIRVSVLSGSATGTVEWEETHATTTDTFGLFTLTIGQGTNTTNGAQTSFADISWGTNTHYLKIEMDVTGGSTYSFMGTNQMMSVPYALYAESANINYDSISNLLSNDSTAIANLAMGVTSAVDLNDFDKEYNLFDAQISWSDDRFVIDVDEDHNVYLATDYEVKDTYNNTIGGQPLYYESLSSDRSIAIAKYDSTGAIQYVQSISLNPDESYEVTDCDLDANGDFLVTGRKFATLNNHTSIFFRKYDNSGNLLFEHVSPPNNGNCDSWKIISDGSGGAYICGVYTEEFDLGNGALLPEDNNKRNQGYIARFDQNGNVLWSDYMGVTTHSASGAGWYDQAQSLVLDLNGNILVAGQIDYLDQNYLQHQHFIRKYDFSGNLLDEQLSNNFSTNISEKDGIRIDVDNNGDIYLYAHHPITANYPSTHIYSFNGLTLDPINGSSQILYKLSSTLTPIYAKNFGIPGSAWLYQMISLNSDNILLSPSSGGPYIIDNIIYSQDINSNAIIELSGNAEFVKYHTLGNNLGSTKPIHIASNSNSTFILYRRDGSFINNGTTYPSGYYVVKENY